LLAPPLLIFFLLTGFRFDKEEADQLRLMGQALIIKKAKEAEGNAYD